MGGREGMNVKVDFEALKRRIVGWLRDLIIVFAMWSIWLVRDYMPDLETKNIVTGFLVTILVIVILIREYIVSLDNKIIGFELEMARIKARDKQ